MITIEKIIFEIIYYFSLIIVTYLLSNIDRYLLISENFNFNKKLKASRV
jgi:hypothetical protein